MHADVYKETDGEICLPESDGQKSAGQIDKKSERHAARRMERQTGGQVRRRRDMQPDGWRGKRADRCSDRKSNMQIHLYGNRQADKQ